MRYTLRVFIWLAFALAAVPAGAQPKPAPQLPTFPQSFTLLPGERTSFGFPVTQAGQVAAEVRWAGGMPLLVTLVDTGGRTMASGNPGTSPARLTYHATPEDVARGMLWRIALAYPPGPSRTPATGSIAVNYPPVAPNLLGSLGARLPTQRQPTNVDAATRALHRSNLARALADLRRPNDARIASYRAQAEAQRDTAVRSYTTQQKVAAAPLPPAQRQALTPAVARLTPAQQRALATGIPTLLEAVPGKASPGEPVLLHGKNFQANPDLRAAFTVRAAYTKTEHTGNPNRPVNVVQVPPLVLTVAVESVKQLPTGAQELLVHMPAPADGSAPAPYDGDVSLRMANGFASNALPFRYEAVVVPVIGGVAPAPVKPGQQASITGAYFASSDVLHMVLPDGQDKIVPSTFVSAGEVRFTVPPYVAQAQTSGQVYMTRLFNGSPFSSRPAPIYLLGTVMDITSLSVAQAAMDYPFIISGLGFEGDTVVTFRLPNGVHRQTVTPSTPSVLHVTVPKMGGVSSNTPCEVSVQSAGKTSRTLKFTYIPTFVFEALVPCIEPFNTDLQFGEPLRTVDRLSGQGFNCGYGFFCSSDWPEGPFVHGNHGAMAVSFFSGQTGYDDYFMRTPLKNGWKMANAIVTVDPRTEKGGAYLTDNGIGTPIPRARVRWWGDWGGTVVYDLSVILTGPYGTSPY